MFYKQVYIQLNTENGTDGLISTNKKMLHMIRDSTNFKHYETLEKTHNKQEVWGCGIQRLAELFKLCRTLFNFDSSYNYFMVGIFQLVNIFALSSSQHSTSSIRHLHFFQH